MELDQSNNQNLSIQSLFMSNNMLKPDIGDDFSIPSKDYLQDFQHLDLNFSYNTFNNPENFTIETNGYYDPFDPFSNIEDNFSSLGDFNFSYELNPFEENGESDSSKVMKNNFHVVEGDEFVKLLNFVVPDDQSSCVTGDHNGYSCKLEIGGRKNKVNRNDNNLSSSMKIKQGGRARKKSKSAKGQWTIEEDKLLIQLVEKFGIRKWSQIAQIFKGRIGKQCRERWHNHLRPDIKKNLWTEEEDRILIQAHGEVGNKWVEIAKRLPGRTENSIKNHWNATKRRQFSRRKCRTKWPRPSSLLQNYIKSLNFQKGISTKKNSQTSNDTNPRGSLVPENKNENLANGPKLHTNIARVKVSPKPEAIEVCQGNNFGDYHFSEVPEFALDDKFFDENGSMDSFMQDINPHVGPSNMDQNYEKCMGLEIMPYNFEVTTLMQGEVNKEMDLMEMISRVNT
ncbi:hypothetical protein K7X08_003916 [Anisodus acutangulus]|uniref:Transcription factor MYB98 n=1 Tax=Anisodus acutangulus TaxID=402998 RepID=A0A9Q1RGY8_9SOLA|nr:hypothetical protein K7X08_003916 [Anisodus acutangulus]